MTDPFLLTESIAGGIWFVLIVIAIVLFVLAGVAWLIHEIDVRRYLRRLDEDRAAFLERRTTPPTDTSQ